MSKIVNTFFLSLIIIFFFSTFKYYSSNKNIEVKKFNQSNIEKIINNKKINLPILQNDTNNVIQFSDGYSEEIINDKTRSFWNLLK
tara:strand:+ start:530 stop:787 length:258 start_codon:yes stop_codon:yes gene_type:complete